MTPNSSDMNQAQTDALKKFQEEHPEITGIYVGGCYKLWDESEFRFVHHLAHTHCKYEGRQSFLNGWICAPVIGHLFTEDGTPTNTMWHELAHVLHPKGGHGAGWRKMARSLGVTGVENYEPAPAKPALEDDERRLKTHYNCGKDVTGCKIWQVAGGWHAEGHNGTVTDGRKLVDVRRQMLHDNHGWFLKGCPECERTGSGWHKES